MLLAVDGDPDALGRVERELRDRYTSSYRVVGTRSPDEALALLTEVADAGEDVALVLAAQWLPEMTGSELLERVRRLHPQAKRGLLVSWGEWGERQTAEAIFDSMALGRIDYYVLRPATSPGRALSPGYLQLPAGVDRGSPDCTAYCPRCSRRLGRESVRAEGYPPALRGAARLLSERLGGGARATCQERGRGEAPADGPSRRSGPERPNEHRDRGRHRWLDRPRPGRIRRGHRRFRTGGPFGGGVWRFRGPGDPRGGRGRSRWTGKLEFADPELPGLPSRGQRQAARRAGLRAGLGLRRVLRPHAQGGQPHSRWRQAGR